MKKIITLLLGGLALGAVLAYMGLVFLGNTPQPGRENFLPRAAAKGLAVADFSLETLNGEAVGLKELRGRVVLINFWATWCEPCKDEMPLIETFFTRYQDQMAVLAINASEDKSTVENYVEQLGLTFPVLLDSKGKVQAQFLVRALPTTVFLDRKGVFQEMVLGPLTEEKLMDVLKTMDVKE